LRFIPGSRAAINACFEPIDRNLADFDEALGMEEWHCVRKYFSGLLRIIDGYLTDNQNLTNNYTYILPTRVRAQSKGVGFCWQNSRAWLGADAWDFAYALRIVSTAPFPFIRHLMCPGWFIARVGSWFLRFGLHNV
jgi:hypothetical protein